MEGVQSIIENNEVFLKEEFIKKFDNFHLIFSIDDPRYLSNIKEFLQINYLVEFEELKKKFKEKGSLFTDVVKENIDVLYELYLALKQDGKFSNKNLGLKYW